MSWIPDCPLCVIPYKIWVWKVSWRFVSFFLFYFFTFLSKGHKSRVWRKKKGKQVEASRPSHYTLHTCIFSFYLKNLKFYGIVCLQYNWWSRSSQLTFNETCYTDCESGHSFSYVPDREGGLAFRGRGSVFAEVVTFCTS